MKRLVVLLTALWCLFLPATALAYNPLGDACHAGGSAAQNSAACGGGNDSIVGSNGVLRKVSLIIAFIAGVVAVIIIIIAGLQYITSGGDSQKAATARSALIGATVGLLIISGAESIIVFVVSKT